MLFVSKRGALTRALFGAALTLGASFAHAAPSLDGVISSGEYGAGPVLHVNPYLNGTDASGGSQSVDLFWSSDATRVYGAIKGDPTLPTSFTPANIYVYSSSLNLDAQGKPGVYGDGNDMIIEGLQYRFSLDGTNTGIWASTPVPLMLSGDTYTDAAGLVSLAFNAATLTEEFSIDRSLLGDYSTFRFGGQLFAYEFNTGSGDREPGALAPVAAAVGPGGGGGAGGGTAVPLPAAAYAALPLIAGLWARRRR